MGKIIAAIGEGVAQFAGPLGAPIKVLLSYQNAENLQRIFDELLKRAAEGNENIEELVASLAVVHDDQREGNRQVVLLLKSIAGLLSQRTDRLELLRRVDHEGSTPDEQIAMISRLLRDNSSNVSQHYVLTEQALLDELLRLVRDQNNLLNAIGLLAPFVQGCFAPGMPPRTAFFNFVVELRGRTSREQQVIFDALEQTYPGSPVFRMFATTYREVAAIEAEV